MRFSAVSYSRYIIFGFTMLILCILLIILYVKNLREQVENTKKYDKDICEVESIEQVRVLFDCWDGGSVSIVEIPCLKVFVNTTNYSSIFFYRTIQERKLSSSNNIEVII